MILHLQVKPKSNKDSITIGMDGTILVKIKALPVSGKANIYLVKYLSEVFQLSKTKITIIKGETSKHKTVHIIADETNIRNVLQALK